MTSEQYEKLIRERPGLRPTIQANCNQNSRTIAKLESDTSNASLEQKKLQGASETAIVRIISVRKHLLDEDNICEKYLVDLLRYSHLIDNDNPQQTSIQTSQRKCGVEEQEHTEITIEIYEYKNEKQDQRKNS